MKEVALTKLFACLLLLAPAFAPALAQDEFKNVQRVVAVGDVHGDYEQFRTILKSAALIDDQGRWSGGKAHLVQTGDVLDRWSESRLVMDSLMALEKQAAEAGGMVHPLLGNHESMNLYGDLRYSVPGEIASYRSANSGQVAELYWLQHIKEMKEKNPAFEADDAYRKKWDAEHPPGFFEYRMAMAPDGVYGRWLRTHNTVVKINGVLFMHGGIAPKYRQFTIRQINDRVRAELLDFNKLPGGMVMDSDGPLWYRGLATDEESELGEYVDEMLSVYGAKRIVVSHTKTPGVILPRFRGKVIMIDVGLSRGYGGPPACLLLEKNKLYALHRGQRFEIPSGSPTETLRYLKQVVELEKEDSALRQAIERLDRRQRD